MLMDSLRENADQFGIVLPLGGPIVECNDSSSEHKFPILTFSISTSACAVSHDTARRPNTCSNPVYAMPLNPDPPYAAPLFNALPGAASHIRNCKPQSLP